jgi:hypothetical protein
MAAVRRRRLRLLALSLALSASMAAIAQTTEDDPDWTESAVPAAPAFDTSRLLTFSGAVSSSLVYGIDPASISFSRSDGLVRYVLVATSASGARNVMYEAIRCSTGEFKTYARYSPDGRWTNVSNPEWRSVFGNMPSKHALYLAKAAVCDGSAPATSVDVVVRRLKNSNYRLTTD